MDTAHAFRENQPLLVLLLAEANIKCKGVLQSFCSLVWEQLATSLASQLSPIREMQADFKGSTCVMTPSDAVQVSK